MNKEYFYPLYKPEDKSLFELLVKKTQDLESFEIVRDLDRFTDFMKFFIYSGKMKDYRKFWGVLRSELEEGKIVLDRLIELGEKIDIQRGIDKSWAIFTQDKRICTLLDEFFDANIKFDGNESEQKEFFLRFWLSQLLQDWRGPKLAVIIESLKHKSIEIKELNKILTNWDFTKIFD